MPLHDDRAGVRDVPTAGVEQAPSQFVVVGVDEMRGEQHEVVAGAEAQALDIAPDDGDTGPDLGQHRGALIDGRHGQPQIPQRVCEPAGARTQVQHAAAGRHQPGEHRRLGCLLEQSIHLDGATVGRDDPGTFAGHAQTGQFRQPFKPASMENVVEVTMALASEAR